jgi:hypothetical protein
MRHLIFLDCEARGTSPVNGTLACFGAVHYPSKETFYGKLFEYTPDPANPAVPLIGERVATDAWVGVGFATWLMKVCEGGRPVMVSDNPAYDFMWIAGMYDRAGLPNPLGHSGRRISDFWAGLKRDWDNTQQWKKLRRTRHDHNPVNDAMGNVEAFEQLMAMLKDGEFSGYEAAWRELRSWAVENLAGLEASAVRNPAQEQVARAIVYRMGKLVPEK